MYAQLQRYTEINSVELAHANMCIILHFQVGILVDIYAPIYGLIQRYSTKFKELYTVGIEHKFK